MPFPSEEEVERLLALPPPPPSPLISLSPPSAEHITALLGFRAAMGRLRASSPSTHHPLHPSPPLPPLPSSLHLPPPVPTSLPLPSSPLPPLPVSLFIPPPIDRREDILEAKLPPCKRLCLTALTSRYKVGESSTAAPRILWSQRADHTRLSGTMMPRSRLREPRSRLCIGNVGVTTRGCLMRDSCQRHWDRFRHFRLEVRLMQMIVRALVVLPRTNIRRPRRTLCYSKGSCCTPNDSCVFVEQLIEARVSAVLANHETLRNITNGHSDRSHNSDTRTGTKRSGLCFTMVQEDGISVPYQAIVLETKLRLLHALILRNALTGGTPNETVTQMSQAYKTGKRMFYEESEEVEKYVGGLPDMIRGNVMSYQPKMMEKEIEFSNDQMDQKYWSPRHFKRDCPNLKHGNRSNQRGNGNAPAKVYMVGNAGTNSDSNVVTGMFLLNDRYASILFDTGAE
ncbi:hypothetical protein Tco_0163174 [Tanacetum coccineum]